MARLTAASRPQRLYSVQALRFVAVLGVLVHHSLNGAFGPPLTQNYVGAAGVDLFFVISGVVIGYVDHGDGAGPFALKRLVRVVPLYWLATLAYIGWRLLATQDQFDATRLATSFLLIPTAARDWVPIYHPGWSLCYELAFYALFGGLLAFARERTALLAAVIAIFLAGVSIPTPGGVLDSKPFLEFAAGLLISLALRHGAVPPRQVGLVAIALAVAGFALKPMPVLGEIRALVWGGPCVLLVLGALSLEDARIFRAKWVSLLGDASYSIYLTHITVMEPIVHYAHAAGLDLESRIRFVLLREAMLVIPAIAVGVAVHLWVERPMLRAMRTAVLGRRKAPLAPRTA